MPWVGPQKEKKKKKKEKKKKKTTCRIEETTLVKGQKSGVGGVGGSLFLWVAQRQLFGSSQEEAACRLSPAT